ncbi:MAG TPA: hypothetical protein PKD54_15315 [Pirellulaceae bacterium]|nr:hypothetical protein [Pirellulaceae bacterium]
MSNPDSTEMNSVAKRWAHGCEVQYVLAVVTGSRHAHGDTDAGPAGAICIDEVGLAKQVVVGDVARHLLGLLNPTNDDEMAILGAGALSGLFLAGMRSRFFGFGFQNYKRKTFVIEQQEVNFSRGDLFDVVAELVNRLGSYWRAVFEADIGRPSVPREKPPSSSFEQSADLDARLSFVH